MLSTPFGTIRIYFDSKITQDVKIRKSKKGQEQLYPDIECAYLLSFEYTADRKKHSFICSIDDTSAAGGIESGEHLEAISFYMGSGKLTIGCESDFGMPEEGRFDFDGAYLKNGFKIEIAPETKSRIFTFAVSWLLNVTNENDVQTWFASDPCIHR